MKGSRAERWGKAILSFLLLLFFSGLGVVCKSFCSPPVLNLSFLPFPFSLPKHFLFFLSPLPSFHLSIFPSPLSSLFIHSCSLFPSSPSPPHPTISHLSFHPPTSPPHPPPLTHIINCRLVKRTNRHNSPDKGIEALITSVLHKELKILLKKDVLSAPSQTKHSKHKGETKIES